MPLLKVLISVALLWWCLRLVDAPEIFATLANIHAGALVGCVAFMVAHTLLCAWRWRMVCRAVGVPGPQPRDALRWMALSVMLSQVLPSTVGGDAYRIGAHARQEGVSGATRCVILDRLSGLWVLAVLGGAASAMTLWITGWVPDIAAAGGLVLAFVTSVPAAAVIGRHRMLQRVAAWRLFASEVATLWRVIRLPRVLASSIAIHSMTIAAVMALCIGLAPGSPLWWQMALLTPAAMVAAAIPVSLGGWGVREAALMLGAAAFAIPQNDALAVSVAYGMMLLFTGALGTVLWAGLPASAAVTTPSATIR